jgi:hypothetical protein
MRPILFHSIIFIGAITNGIAMAAITSNRWIIIGTTIFYVLLFELVFLYLHPRLIKAERIRNLRKYPLFKQLVEAKKVALTLKSGEVLYQVTFQGYSTEKETKAIVVAIHKPKQGKQAPTVEKRVIEITEITAVKLMKV